jgi:hypothetical protein
MPPAKKTTTRGASRGSRRDGTVTAATRARVAKATRQLEKALDQANDALKALGKDAGKGGQRSYKNMGNAVSAMRRDARKTNRALLSDLSKLRAAVSPKKTAKKPAKKRATAKKRSTATRSRTKTKAASRSTKSRRPG